MLSRRQLAILSIVLAASLNAAVVAAEEPPSEGAALALDGPRHTLQVDPLTTALGFVHVQIERRLADSWSLYVGPHMRLFDGIAHDGDESIRGLGVEAGLRWFAFGGAPRGFWGQVRAVAAVAEAAGDRMPVGYASALAGHTWILGDRWVLSAGLGVQYIDYAIDDIGTRGVLPAAHTTFGFAF